MPAYIWYFPISSQTHRTKCIKNMPGIKNVLSFSEFGPQSWATFDFFYVGVGWGVIKDWHRALLPQFGWPFLSIFHGAFFLWLAPPAPWHFCNCRMKIFFHPLLFLLNLFVCAPIVWAWFCGFLFSPFPIFFCTFTALFLYFFIYG